MLGRDGRVPLEAQLELHLSRVGELPLELAELLLGVAPDRVADLEVLALYLESHRFPFAPRERSACTPNLADRPREGHDLDAAGAGLPERRRPCARGRSA